MKEALLFVSKADHLGEQYQHNTLETFIVEVPQSLSIHPMEMKKSQIGMHSSLQETILLCIHS